MEQTIQIHDIGKGEFPEKDGSYYIAVKDVLDGGWRLFKVLWNSEKKCWRFDTESSTFFEPTSYWGDIWMNTDIEKGFEALWEKK